MATISRRSAFTLIELLVVISIILIATSVLFIGGGGGGDGIKLSSAQRIVSSIAQGARGQAILKNATTRLIIYTDSDTNQDDEKKLRYFGIIHAVVELDEDDNEVIRWKAATQGTYLPEGIYFNKDLGADVPTDTMNLNYPRISAQDEGSGDGAEEYFYYEFSRNGTMATGFDNSWLGLQAGQLLPDADDASKLVIDFDGPENENLKAALIFRRVGTTTMVTDPDEITENN